MTTLSPNKAASANVADAAKEGKYNSVPPGSGILHTYVPEGHVIFDQAPNERVVQQGNTYIVQGTDRPTNLASGYGAVGAGGCNTIDIVVGRMSSELKASPSRINPGTMTQNNFVCDAARIYISQMTDVDDNFSLANGKIGSKKAASAIALKADGVRIIGREGVKIVTGGAVGWSTNGRGETNSKDEALPRAAPIELIAGNRTGDVKFKAGLPSPGGAEKTVKALQPLLKGDNTRMALQEITELIQDMLGIMLNIAVMQTTFNSILGVTIYPGIQPHFAGASVQTSTQYISKYINSIYQSRLTLGLLEFNYLESPGRRFICSPNVYST
tara:strand:+ start:344 stop:1327 length:984 start_codon:yes stop_codon:yes gene_type:complete